MVKLAAKSPLDDLAPGTIGTCTVTEVDLGTLTSVAPFQGQGIADAFNAAHGMAWPSHGRATGKEGSRAIWFGRNVVLLAGPDADPILGRHAALTDQTDAWATVTLSGVHAEDVLARLVPLDISAATFKRGHTARTQIQHMAGSVTRIGNDTFLLMVFRSMAGTLVHDLERAMASVAARG